MASIQKREGKRGTTYRVQVRRKGHPPETATFERLTDARQWAQQTETAITEGRHLLISQARRRTFAEMIDRYIREVIEPRNYSKRHSPVARLLWWRDQLGPYHLAAVTPAKIADARDSLNRAPTTVTHYLALLSKCYSVAVNEWGWVEVNPVRRVARPRLPRGRVRFLDDDERERLLDACRNSPSAALYDVVVLALYTGGRQGEILNLTWDDVDFKGRRVIFRNTKNGETRAVSLVALAYDVLEARSKVQRIDTNLVFPAVRRKAKGPIAIKTAWQRAVKNAGIEDFRFHDLRHTAASYLAMKGATLRDLAEILGHKTPAMVMRYAHLTEGHTRELLEKVWNIPV